MILFQNFIPSPVNIPVEISLHRLKVKAGAGREALAVLFRVMAAVSVFLPGAHRGFPVLHRIFPDLPAVGVVVIDKPFWVYIVFPLLAVSPHLLHGGLYKSGDGGAPARGGFFPLYLILTYPILT